MVEGEESKDEEIVRQYSVNINLNEKNKNYNTAKNQKAINKQKKIE